MVKAVALADDGKERALAALLALVMGCGPARSWTGRCGIWTTGESCSGSIPDSKTEAGRRTLQVPELQPYPAELGEREKGKPSEASSSDITDGTVCASGSSASAWGGVPNVTRFRR